MEPLKPFVEAMGLRPDFDKLTTFHEALYEANQTKNLTRTPLVEAWSRHYLDSILFQDLIPQGSRVLDIGTGPGFPAWPLAWARPDLHVTALDSNGKMLGFLRTQPLPNLAVIEERAEDWKTRTVFDVVTGRAIAPLPIQIELSDRLVRDNGLVMPLRTKNDAAEIERLREVLGLVLTEVAKRDLALPGGEVAERWFPIWRKVRRTPRGYPRSWAEMRRAPL